MLPSSADFDDFAAYCNQYDNHTIIEYYVMG